jgi:hypothetical protein
MWVVTELSKVKALFDSTVGPPIGVPCSMGKKDGLGLGVDATHPSGERSFRVAVAPSYAEVVSSVVSSSDMQLLAANGNLGQRADFLLPMRGPYFSSDGGAVNGEMLRSGEANSGSVG